MITYPNCKINLGLHVVGKRPDGYHDLETIFLPVHTLHDELEITIINPSLSSSGEAQAPRMQQDGIALDNAPEDNLCMKAWRLLHEEFDIPAVNIRLKKGIPFGAGLGSGSSDAAFTLKMLNEMFALNLSNSQLEQRAAKLGADCAFFIQNRPAYATGIGDRLENFEFRISNFEIKIEIPDGEHVSTKEAYSGLHLTEKTETDRIRNNSVNSVRTTPQIDLREAVKRPVEEWRSLIVNDFEASVFPSHPAIAALKEDMYKSGALYASMTGSGAAVFGIFA